MLAGVAALNKDSDSQSSLQLNETLWGSQVAQWFEHLPLAQGVILGSWDRVLYWAPRRELASPSAYVSHE